MSGNVPKLGRKEICATVTEVLNVAGGTGTIRYQVDNGTSGFVDVIAEGWGDGYPSYWPPAVGDVITIIVQPAVILRWRPR